MPAIRGPAASIKHDGVTVNADSTGETIQSSRSTDVGVVIFWESMQLRYANDEARSYMARAGRMNAVLSHKEDLRLAIVKLGVHVKNRGAEEMGTVPNGVLATRTVRTPQGLFKLHALEMPDHDQEAGPQIVIVIEDCRKERSPPVKETSTASTKDETG